MINYLTVNGIARRFGLSSHTIKSYIELGRFPAPDAAIGAGKAIKYGWLPQTVDNWQASRPGKPGRPKGSIKQQP
ncbi:MAG: helix-turn-helix transcriptional regulator [Varibaculum timonense]